MAKRKTVSSAQWIWQQADWPAFHWDAAALSSSLAQARQNQGRLSGYARILDPASGIQAEADLLLQDALNTAAIEGETLSPERLRSSIGEKLGLGRGALMPARNEEGLVEVLLDATHKHRTPLTLERLCRWQAALFPTGQSGLLKIRAGELRGTEPMRVVSGPLHREKVHFEAPPRKGLEREVSAFLRWFAHPPQDLDGLVRAGLAHLWFVTVHPFEDGNGRLARGITDMALAQDEDRPQRLFSLSAQIMRVRNGYYEILERTQRDGLEVTDWLQWFLQQVCGACELAEATIANTLAKARFWLRHADKPLNERQRKALNRLLDAGPGGFEGGMSTRKYASLTRVGRVTAYKELAALAALGCLVPAGGAGRSSAYDVPWGEFRGGGGRSQK